MDEDLNVGDVVNLNSGSPDMTVTRTTMSDVTVSWINDGATQSAIFPKACLKKK